jgi:integrase
MAYAEKDSRTKKLTGRWAVDRWYKYGDSSPDRRFRKAFMTKKEAEGWEAYVMKTGLEPPDAEGNQRPIGPTFKEAAAEMRAKYDVWKKGRDPSGQRRLDWIISKIGHRPLAQVSTGDLDDIVLDLLRRPVRKGHRNPKGQMKGRTVNGYLTMASAVLTWSASRPKDYGDFKPPVIPLQATEETRIVYMTDEQEKLLVTYMTNKGFLNSALTIRVLRASGMRWGEFEGLEPQMVQTVKRANGQLIGWIKLDKTKTDTPRDIPITPKMAGELRALLANGARPNYWTIRRQFDEAKKVLGLPPGLTMYGARHAAATYLTKRGLQPAKIKQFMGHKSYKTTEKYIHVENEDLVEAAEILNPNPGWEPETEEVGEVVAFNKVS